MKINLEEKYDCKVAARWVGGIFVFCVAAFFILLFWWNQRIAPVDISRCQKDNGRITCKVDKYYGDNFIRLTGYAYEKGVSINFANLSVIAYNPEKDRYYELPTECVEKKKITEKENDGYNYDNCGFISVVFSKKIWNGTKFYLRYRHNGVDVLLDTGMEFTYERRGDICYE